MRAKRSVVALLGAALFVLGSVAASAQVAGHRVTITNIDYGTNTVDVDVTGYMDATYTFSTLWLGFNTYFGSIGAPALDWGDGSTVAPYGNGPSTGIPIVATSTNIGGFNVNVYRGGFSHAYGAPGLYTITANSVPRPINHTLVAGTTATTPTYFGTYNYSFAQDTTQADLAPVQPVIEIPTASEVGLLLLAIGLVGASILTLRRVS